MSTYTDGLHRALEVKTSPQRIVSLVPSITETLFTFGLNEEIAGVTTFCVEPGNLVAGKLKVGGTKTLDVEQIIALEPDLVLANAEENREQDIRQLVRRGLTVFVTFPRTVAAAISMMKQIADMTGAMDNARPVIEAAEAALNDVRNASAGRRIRVFCPIWRRPWMTIGRDTYMSDFITVCGGVNIFADRHDRYPRMELEEVARRAPQIILLPDEPYPFAPKHIQEFSRYPYVPAVRDNRVHLIDGKDLCWYGPRMATSLRQVYSLLWPDDGDAGM
jgi:ABC-type Fe3+-hydroxamate transport system substrate-binding protein